MKYSNQIAQELRGRSKLQKYSVPKTRQQIFLAAAHLFARKGYKGTGLNDIAKSAKVNKATIYYHFKNKAAILYEIAVNPIYELVELGRPVLESKRSPSDKLEALIENHIEWLISHPINVSMYQFLRMNLPPKLYKEYVNARADYLAMFEKVIQEGTEKREFMVAAPFYDSLFIVIFLNALIQRLNPSEEFSQNDIISSASKLIFQALKLG